jgi:hypothetical protein
MKARSDAPANPQFDRLGTPHLAGAAAQVAEMLAPVVAGGVPRMLGERRVPNQRAIGKQDERGEASDMRASERRGREERT